MPYFCHIHNGLYQSIEGIEGCQHDQCISFRGEDIGPAGVHVVGFAGSDATKAARAHSRGFNRDMNDYYYARKQGVEPEQVSSRAAAAALARAERES